MSSGFFWQAIYWLSSPILAILVVLLLVRHLQRHFPVFFSYILVLFLIDVARLLAYRTTSITYYYVYWISDAVGTLFALMTVSDLIFRRLFPRFYSLNFYRYLFSLAAVIIVAFTALTAYSSHPKNLLSQLLTILHTGNFLLTAMLFFLVALMVIMGRQWGPYEFGIALGLAVNAAALLTTLAYFAKSVPAQKILRNIALYGEDAASVIWLITFWKPKKLTTAQTVPVSAELLTKARKWQEAAKSSLTKKKDSE